MTVSLHTATIGTYLQILPSVLGLIDKAEAHCRQHGLPDTALTGARLADDMWDFARQASQAAHHSARAVAGVGAGVFGPDMNEAPHAFAPLRAEIADAITALEAVTRDEIDANAGRAMRFEFGTTRMDFTVADFLLTFSLPNFYFHTATAYGILRHHGVAVGKRDYLGAMRMTRAG